jgi:ABC-type lipoprotein release transport system permease subunit
MWLKKIKKRKMQFFIMAILLMISTAILIACISFTMETKKFVDDYYSYDKSPICFDTLMDKDGVEILQENEKVMNLVNKIETGEARYVQDEFFIGDKKLNNDSIQVYGMDDVTSLAYSLTIAKGEEKQHPGDGEMWICHVFANAVNLQVGDKFTIGEKDGKTYTISAIVNTPECSSGFIDNYLCYVNSKTLGQMSGLKTYGIRMYAKSDDVTIKAINEALPEAYKSKLIASIDANTLKMCLSILSGIFGGVGVGAALLILGVSIIVIRYMIRAVIDKEYHMIGIYKAIGRNNFEIKTIYLVSYMVVGISGMVLGLLLGRPVAIYLANVILGNMKGFQVS